MINVTFLISNSNYDFMDTCMQDTFARAKHYAAGRPSAARDDRVSCIQYGYLIE